MRKATLITDVGVRMTEKSVKARGDAASLRDFHSRQQHFVEATESKPEER